ncbi:MAG: SDR family oxidoreductase [Alphaproteobacteria bacterium]|nr:SDR family oxidoreductase [Alphaproteobacteria bacterium]
MNNICLITGASSGIGRSLAIQMAQKGFYIIAIARNIEKLNELALEIGLSQIKICVCDVSDAESIRKVSENLVQENLIPSIFFLNAGDGLVEPIGNLNLETHQKTFAVNYFGAIQWIDEFMPLVKEKGAKFIATSSILTYFATPGGASYCASKSALKACFDALRRQYLGTKLEFVCVHPGPTDTNMLKTHKKLPFVWLPEKAASYMIKKVFASKKVIAFPFFWRCFFRILSILPDAWVMKVLK